MNRLLTPLLLMLVAPAGCTTEFVNSDEDTASDTTVPTDTATDTGVDGVDDPVTDTTVDPVADTAVDTSTDTVPDTSDCVPITAEQGGACNILEQCGCEDPAWCLFAVNFMDCVVVEQCTANARGEQWVGDYCDPSAEFHCAPGLECLPTPEGNRCFQYCRYDEDCVLEGETCWMPLDMYGSGPCEGESMAVPLLLCSTEEPTCVQQCENIFDDSSCMDDQACAYDFACDTLVCAPYGTDAVGDSCAEQTCERGAVCITDGPGDGVCVPWCDDDHPCSGSMICSTLAIPSWPELSVCY